MISLLCGHFQRLSIAHPYRRRPKRASHYGAPSDACRGSMMTRTIYPRPLFAESKVGSASGFGSRRNISKLFHSLWLLLPAMVVVHGFGSRLSLGLSVAPPV